MPRNLRQKERISYYEPNEPPIDSYVYCESCADYVYEYCSLHGPLLVVPDDKLKKKLRGSAPVAALTIPHVFLHLAPSIIPGAGIGVFSSLTLPRGVRFGPFRGKKTNEVSSDYCWQIVDSENRPSHVVDAADENNSNWMRYVNCARHWREQNLVAFQYKGQIYYRTIKIIPRFTELLVYYGSEFAHRLHVDLHQYNSPEGYVKVLLDASNNQMKSKNTIKEATQTATSSQNHSTKANEIEDFDIEMEPVTINETTCKKTVDATNFVNFTKFICNDCGFTTNEKEMLVKHIHALMFECNQCNFQTMEHSFFKKHFMLHDESRPLVCDICRYRFSHAYNLKRHRKVHLRDGLEENHGPIKDQNFNHHSTNANEIEDFDIEMEPVTIDEPTCEKTVDATNYVNFTKFICDDCGFRTNEKEKLVKHKHALMFECNQCNLQTTEHSFFKKHYMLHDETRPLVCDICRYRFSHAYNLKRHRKVHLRYGLEENNDPIKDENFNEKQKQIGNLSSSYMIGIVEENIKPKASIAEDDPKEIITDENDNYKSEEPYRKSFRYNTDQNHNVEKPIQISQILVCDKCPFKTDLPSFFKKHSFLHEETRPFVCITCGYRFQDIRGLTSHRKTHFKVKNESGGRIKKRTIGQHVCSDCKIVFRTKYCLSRHSKIHEGDTPYKCHVCSAEYKFKASLSFHLKNHN